MTPIECQVDIAAALPRRCPVRALSGVRAHRALDAPSAPWRDPGLHRYEHLRERFYGQPITARLTGVRNRLSQARRSVARPAFSVRYPRPALE